MFDGLYQSLMCFFMPYLLFAAANFNAESGLSLNDNRQMGVYIANSAVIVVNTYILMNMYQWDAIMTTVSVVSILLIFAWTGIYTSFTASFQFYKAGQEVYGSLSFWAVILLTVSVCLLPRFGSKAIQKVFFPRDVDIIREQVKQGKFKYLDQEDPTSLLRLSKPTSLSSSDASPRAATTIRPDDERPFYPPSEARTSTIAGDAGAIGSDTSRFSAATSAAPTRPSFEKRANSYERSRQSMDRLRPSFEGTRGDMTTSLGLMRIESAHTRGQRHMSAVTEERAR